MGTMITHMTVFMPLIAWISTVSMASLYRKTNQGFDDSRTWNRVQISYMGCDMQNKMPCVIRYSYIPYSRRYHTPFFPAKSPAMNRWLAIMFALF